jgi:hypothetical protein
LKKERKKERKSKEERKRGRKKGSKKGEREEGRRSIYVCFGNVHELGDQRSLSGGDGGSRSSSMSAGISEPN